MITFNDPVQTVTDITEIDTTVHPPLAINTVKKTPAVTETTVTVEMPTINEKAWDFCSKISHSLLVPENIRSTETSDHTADLYALMSLGSSLGFNLMQTLQGVYILPGSARPSLYTSAKRALVLKHGGVFEREDFDEATQTAFVTINRNGQRITRSFSVLQACAMGKMYRDPNDGQYKGCQTKNGKSSPWAMDYRNMCLIRAVSRCCDAAYPDILMGLPSYEDAIDSQYQPVEELPVIQPKTEDGLSEIVKVNPKLKQIVKPKKTKEITAETVDVSDVTAF